MEKPEWLVSLQDDRESDAAREFQDWCNSTSGWWLRIRKIKAGIKGRRGAPQTRSWIEHSIEVLEESRRDDGSMDVLCPFCYKPNDFQCDEICCHCVGAISCEGFMQASRAGRCSFRIAGAMQNHRGIIDRILACSPCPIPDDVRVLLQGDHQALMTFGVPGRAQKLKPAWFYDGSKGRIVFTNNTFQDRALSAIEDSIRLIEHVTSENNLDRDASSALIHELNTAAHNL